MAVASRYVPRIVVPHHFVLLDRDGVINRMRGDYVKTWKELEVLPGALEAIARVNRTGREIIVLTNQSGISRNLVSADVVDDIHHKLAKLVARRGGQIRAFLVCPHSPRDGCNCRKPAPGLFFRARDELGVDLARAIMVGDQALDIQAAQAAGCDGILVDPAHRHARLAEIFGCATVKSLVEAAELICAE
jgi:D-glycero-D-manno-heptose 1,7-bisphosphate phosphatase